MSCSHYMLHLVRFKADAKRSLLFHRHACARLSQHAINAPLHLTLRNRKARCRHSLLWLWELMVIIECLPRSQNGPMWNNLIRDVKKIFTSTLCPPYIVISFYAPFCGIPVASRIKVTFGFPSFVSSRTHVCHGHSHQDPQCQRGTVLTSHGFHVSSHIGGESYARCWV